MNALEQLSGEYFEGVLQIMREPAGLRLDRLTPAQMAYCQPNPALAVRAKCCAGAILAFRTDSNFLDMKFAILDGCRALYGIDVEIDGVLSHAVRVDQREATLDGRLFDLPDRREREIRVFLPCTVEIRLQEVGLADGATLQPVPRKKGKLLCLGDSITQGMEARSPHSTYAFQLARLLDMELLNLGVGGHVFDAAFLDPNLPFRPDLVTVAYGTNDWTRGMSIEQVRCNAREFLAKLQSIHPPRETSIVVISPLWRTPPAQPARNDTDLAAFSRAILETAGEFHRVTPIAGLELVPNQPWYFVDGLHPNDTGFLYYAVNLYRKLRETGVVRVQAGLGDDVPW